jgi:FtsH-binding integral membrane protein
MTIVLIAIMVISAVMIVVCLGLIERDQRRIKRDQRRIDRLFEEEIRRMNKDRRQ